MSSVFRALLVLALAAVCVAGPTGCTSKEEPPTNPDLKVPDVPPSGRDMKKTPGKK